MVKQRVVVGFCCAVALLLCGCSRQQSDWQKTREVNTADAYEQFLKKYPTGEFTAQAQARVKEMYEEGDWQKARDADTPEAYQAFLKQYPDGKWTEEARIRVENFTLAQAPGFAAPTPGGVDSGAAPAVVAPGTGDAAKVVPASGAGDASSAPTPVAPAPPTAGTAHGPASGVATRAASPKTKAEGSYGVQLGAFKSGASAAHDRWAHLQKKYPVLAGLSSKVSAKTTAAGRLYRLQAMGLTEKHARAICSSLAAQSQPCVVVSPVHG